MLSVALEYNVEHILKEFNRLLTEKNKVINLTAHKTEAESFKNNIEDSLLFLDHFPQKARVLDLGSGCGCPAIPLKIAQPGFDITMIDSVRKKTDFLNEAINALKLENIAAVHARIEDFAIKNRETFDIVTARAVAELPTLLEYAMPHLKVGGELFAFKGKNWQQEIDKSANALKVLGATVTQTLTANLDGIDRYLIVIKKISPTPTKYPRAKNLPRLKPL